jgi:hypothetical protein
MRAVDVVREERHVRAAAAARYLRRLLRAHPELAVTRVATGRGGGKVAYCDAETEATLRALCHRIETEVPPYARGLSGAFSGASSGASSGAERVAASFEWVYECTTHEALAMHARLSALEQSIAETRHAARSARLVRGLRGLSGLSGLSGPSGPSGPSGRNGNADA